MSVNTSQKLIMYIFLQELHNVLSIVAFFLGLNLGASNFSKHVYLLVQ